MADARIPGDGLRLPERELVPLAPRSGMRCLVHDFPHPLARWHSHPEIEIHLITRSSGTAHIGSTVRVFEPGSFYLMGSNVPHNWVSSVSTGEVVQNRDVLAHLDPDAVTGLVQSVPDLEPVGHLLGQAASGLEFTGQTRLEAAGLLMSMQTARGARGFALAVELLALLAEAPARDREVVDPFYSGTRLQPADAQDFDVALTYLHEHLTEPIGLREVAAFLRRSPSSVSRLFTRATVVGFSRTVNRMRIAEACRLLRTTSESVGDICWRSGFTNLSNFNRRFKEETGSTPREYRRSLDT